MRYFETVDVDEFRTSSICRDCDPLYKVIKEVEDDHKVLQIRRSRRCCSIGCSWFSLKNRDLVGDTVMSCSERTPSNQLDLSWLWSTLQGHQKSRRRSQGSSNKKVKTMLFHRMFLILFEEPWFGRCYCDVLFWKNAFEPARFVLIVIHFTRSSKK